MRKRQFELFLAFFFCFFPECECKFLNCSGTSCDYTSIGLWSICVSLVAMTQTLQTSRRSSDKYGAEDSDLFADSSKPTRKGQIERENYHSVM